MSKTDQITQEILQQLEKLPWPQPFLLLEVLRELERARRKHPSWPEDQIHAAAIVAEESGELIRACINHSYEGGAWSDCLNEAIQTGAMALRFLFETAPKTLEDDKVRVD